MFGTKWCVINITIYVSRILEVNRCCGRWKEIRGKGTCAQEMQSRVDESQYCIEIVSNQLRLMVVTSSS